MGKLTRRTFIRYVIGAALLAASGSLLKSIFFPSRISKHEARSLRAYIDTLVPSDSISRGAVELGVTEKILASARTDKKLRRLIKSGAGWLNRRAWLRRKGSFSSLEPGARNEVVSLSASARRGAAERVFYDRIRLEVFHHYYAMPETWAVAGYEGPPQPKGYPEYHSPYKGPAL